MAALCEYRLKGHGGSAAFFSSSSHMPHLALDGQGSSPRAAQRLHAGLSGQAVVGEAHQALKSAVGLCQRHSQDTSQEAAQHLWFCVLQVTGFAHCRTSHAGIHACCQEGLPKISLPQYLFG